MSGSTPILIALVVGMVMWPSVSARHFGAARARLVPRAQPRCRLRTIAIRASPGAGRVRQEILVRRLPELVDMVALGVSAGLTGRDALFGSASRAAAEYRDAIERCRGRVTAGADLAGSFDRLVDDLGDVIRPLTGGILAAERDGVPLEPLLRRAADEARRKRRIQAETAARRLPVLMLFPLVMCVLPAFVLLSVVPLLADSISSLDLSG